MTADSFQSILYSQKHQESSVEASMYTLPGFAYSASSHIYSDLLWQSQDLCRLEPCRSPIYLEMVDKLIKGSFLNAAGYSSHTYYILKLYHEEERATDDDALPIAEFKGKHIILYEDCYPFLDMLFGTLIRAQATIFESESHPS